MERQARKVERVSLDDESSRAWRRGNALNGGNPMSVSGTKQGHRCSRGSTPQGSERGRRGMAFRSGIRTMGQPSRLARARALKGRRSSREAPGGADRSEAWQHVDSGGDERQRRLRSLKRVRSSREDEPHSFTGLWGRRWPEGPKGERKQRRRGFGEPDSRYGQRLETLRSTVTS